MIKESKIEKTLNRYINVAAIFGALAGCGCVTVLIGIVLALFLSIAAAGIAGGYKEGTLSQLSPFPQIAAALEGIGITIFASGIVVAIIVIIAYLIHKNYLIKLIKRSDKETEQLVLSLFSSDREIRRAAADTLDKCGWFPKDGITEVQYKIAKEQWDLLIGSGQIATEPLTKLLKDSDTEIKEMAAKMLGIIGDEKAREPLTEALKDRNKNVKIAAYEALKKIDERKTIFETANLDEATINVKQKEISTTPIGEGKYHINKETNTELLNSKIQCRICHQISDPKNAHIIIKDMPSDNDELFNEPLAPALLAGEDALYIIMASLGVRLTQIKDIKGNVYLCNRCTHEKLLPCAKAYLNMLKQNNDKYRIEWVDKLINRLE
ncbi:MAG: HEAT repeat domain-containing protein [Dehalococcoidia bacterium]|nr:HEAT repeat domain-containing protein [Dehalococcoidia bacterium]